MLLRRSLAAWIGVALLAAAEEPVVENSSSPASPPNDTSPVVDSTNATDPSNQTAAATAEEGVLVKKSHINYASMDAGALILETSASSSGFQNLLLDDKDKYGITPCAEKKMVVIGLSEDILAREIVLAQYEKYSSGVREFRVSGARVFPTQEWSDLGTFEAKYGEGEQSFSLEAKWVRYVKVRFMSHYGNEYSCTLSQIKVHGITMTENFHEDLNRHREEVEESLTALADNETEECSAVEEVVDFPVWQVVIQQEPEASNVTCLQALEPNRFRARIAKPSTDVAFVEYNSIFKTLMDKIKAFEINQTITELYLERLHACFTQTVDDIEKDYAAKIQRAVDRLRTEHAASASTAANHHTHHRTASSTDALAVQDAILLAGLALAASVFVLLIFSCFLCLRMDKLATHHYHYYHHHPAESAEARPLKPAT